MPTQCVLCGQAVSQGIVCDRCERRKRPAAKATVTAVSSEPATAADPFPKAPIVPFPVESTSPAITSISEILSAARVPSVILAADQSVKFISDEARQLLGLSESDPVSVKTLESRLALRIPSLTENFVATVQLAESTATLTLVPLSSGAGGAVLILRSERAVDTSSASLMSYVSETILAPLRALQSALVAGAARGTDPLLQDAASTLDQILSSVEISPMGDSEGSSEAPAATEIVRMVGERFARNAELKKVSLQIDAQEMSDRFQDHEALQHALSILMENALHYVPAGGQIVLGLRALEHKGRRLLLFFAMDNGPVIPVAMREEVFDSSFIWKPSSAERTGKNLAQARAFATAHGGQIWIESKTGKTCTVFLRVVAEV